MAIEPYNTTPPPDISLGGIITSSMTWQSPFSSTKAPTLPYNIHQAVGVCPNNTPASLLPLSDHTPATVDAPVPLLYSPHPLSCTTKREQEPWSTTTSSRRVDKWICWLWHQAWWVSMFDADLLIDCCRLEIDLQIINFLQSSRSSLHHHHQRKLLPICPALLLTLYTNQTPSDTTTGVPSAAPAICIYFNFDKTWGYLEVSAERLCSFL